MASPVFLRGDSVTLRPIDEAHLDFFLENINDPEVWQGLQHRAPISRQEEREWLESGGDDDAIRFAIYADDEPVGSVGFREINETWGTATVGYWVTPDEQGQGYATEATELAVGYAFDQRRFDKVRAYAFAHNEPSRAVLESVGFTQEGVMRDDAFVDGERVDLVSYGLLAEEWWE